jgi:predicted dehydrogenase
MKIAVIGLGFMGSTHLKAIRDVPGAELVAVASNEEYQLTGDLSRVQGNIGGPGEKMDFSALRRYTDAMQAVRDPEVEAVDICLPTAMHEAVATEALRRGKHVLVEKPMALDGAAADRLAAEAVRQGKVLMVGQVLRFWPAYVALRELLRDGGLGPVHSVMFRRRCAARAVKSWIADRSLSGGGAFDLLIHDVDMCLHLFGAPAACTACGHEDLAHGVDVVTAQLHYPGIASVTVTGGWHHPKSYPFSMEYTVVTEGGTVEYSSAGRPPTLYDGRGEIHVLSVPEQDPYLNEIRYFVACSSAGRPPALCPPEESAAAVKLTRMIMDARSCKGERFACNL